MVALFGRSLSRAALQRQVGSTAQIFGVTLTELADGPARGVRALEFRTGAGLLFSVLVDRSMDIGRLEFRGIPLAWQSGTGFRGPWFHDAMDEAGQGFTRGFSGFLCTCGFDHIRQPEAGPADHFPLPSRKTIDYPLHGRGALAPARLVGYGERWDDDDCTLWCEGVVAQVQVMGENLTLTRRVEAKADGTAFAIHDTVRNEGFSRTPHMLLYHINLGWPLLDEGARFRAPIRATLAANHPREAQRGGYRTQSGPQPRFAQQVFGHDAVPDGAGRVPSALINDRLGLGVVVDYPHAAFPCLQQWQGFDEGHYGFGIEPATSHWGTRAHAAENGEIIWLAHGESRVYDTRIAILDGAQAIAAFDARVDAIHPQLADERPARSRQPATTAQAPRP